MDAGAVVPVAVAVSLIVLLTLVTIIIVITVVYLVQRRRYHHYQLHRNIAMSRLDDESTTNLIT